MRVVLDSNIFLSALISPHGPPHCIYQAWRQGAFDLVTCTAQLDELRRASRYPKFRDILQPHRVGLMINNLNRAIVIDRLPKGFESADPDDAWLLAVAEEGSADHLVTGDKRAGLLRMGHTGATRIVTAVAFCHEAL
jgi:putative PIN family toxin of toxin-antitoxin system